MTTISRRDLGMGAGAGLGAALASGAGLGTFAIAQNAAKVVVIGGGPGGATVANRLKRDAPQLDVTLIEPAARYATCFFSNLYLGGFRGYDQQLHGYDGIAALGVRVVHDRAGSIDIAARMVRTLGGTAFAYDRLVVAPGIEIKYGQIEGYSREASARMPHAYIAGTQTELLKRQLDAMPDGGTVLIAPPGNPYRCPPGPYERACLIAHYLKTRKPKSKLVIYDPKNAFSKQELFTEAFRKYYDGIVELNLTNEIDDFGLARVDAAAMTVTTKAGETVKADVINVIPNQRAGDIALAAGLGDGDWCPVDPVSFASRKARDVYVLGDAAIGADMPKSAFSANSQAKVVATDIVASLAGKARPEPGPEPSLGNICWSMLAPDDSVKLGAGYLPKGGKLEAVGPFISKAGEGAAVRKATYEESVVWYGAFIEDVFGR